MFGNRLSQASDVSDLNLNKMRRISSVDNMQSGTFKFKSEHQFNPDFQRLFRTDGDYKTNISLLNFEPSNNLQNDRSSCSQVEDQTYEQCLIQYRNQFIRLNRQTNQCIYQYEQQINRLADQLKCKTTQSNQLHEQLKKNQQKLKQLQQIQFKHSQQIQKLLKCNHELIQANRKDQRNIQELEILIVQKQQTIKQITASSNQIYHRYLLNNQKKAKQEENNMHSFFINFAHQNNSSKNQMVRSDKEKIKKDKYQTKGSFHQKQKLWKLEEENQTLLEQIKQLKQLLQQKQEQIQTLEENIRQQYEQIRNNIKFGEKQKSKNYFDLKIEDLLLQKDQRIRELENQLINLRKQLFDLKNYHLKQKYEQKYQSFQNSQFSLNFQRKNENTNTSFLKNKLKDEKITNNIQSSELIQLYKQFSSNLLSFMKKPQNNFAENRHCNVKKDHFSSQVKTQSSTQRDFSKKSSVRQLFDGPLKKKENFYSKK